MDEHYYRDPVWFTEAFTRYDNYDRQRPKVYVGEYAVSSQYGKVGNMNAALGEAVYMLGMERNSDVVSMCSYAPLFVNDNASSWSTDLIHYNASYAFGTPSYWAEQMFSTNLGNRLINSKMEWELPVVQAKIKHHPVQVGLSTWETKATFKNPHLLVDGIEVSLPDFKQWETSEKGNWQNSDGTVTNQGKTKGGKLICPVQIQQGHHYTYCVQARKEEGNEGFLVVFNYQNDTEYDWFNIAGSGNTANNFEQCIDNGHDNVTLTESKKFQIENGKWYNLCIEAEEDSMAAYIDDEYQMSAVHLLPITLRGVYHDVTMDEASNRLYIKVVNVGNTGSDGTINLTNGIASRAEMIRLNSDNSTDENTQQYPLNIIPLPADVDVINEGKQVTFAVAPFSINIITVDLK